MDAGIQSARDIALEAEIRIRSKVKIHWKHRRSSVGWVERSDTHHSIQLVSIKAQEAMGIGTRCLNPTDISTSDPSASYISSSRCLFVNRSILRSDRKTMSAPGGSLPNCRYSRIVTYSGIFGNQGR